MSDELKVWMTPTMPGRASGWSTVDGGGHHLANGVVGESGHLAEQFSVVQEIGPEHFWKTHWA